MAGWPKTIYIRGVGIPVDSWEELDKVIECYGAEGPIIIQGTPGKEPVVEKKTLAPSSLGPSDRSLLQQFVQEEDRGVPTSQIGPALGKRGKGIRRALEVWSRRIGLVTQEGASAFEPVKTAKGRGFRMIDIYLQAARSMLGS